MTDPAWLTIVIARSAPMLIIFIDQALPRCRYSETESPVEFRFGCKTKAILQLAKPSAERPYGTLSPPEVCIGKLSTNRSRFSAVTSSLVPSSLTTSVKPFGPSVRAHVEFARFSGLEAKRPRFTRLDCPYCPFRSVVVRSSLVVA
jgi:hypothetical protein